MTLLRVVAFATLGTTRAEVELWPALQLGWRYDARVVAAILLPLLLLGWNRWLDPFGTRGARRLWFGWLGSAAGALAIVFACDFLHYHYLGQRLNATALGFLADAGISLRMSWESYPLGRIVLAVAAATAALVWAVRRLHRWAAAAPTPAARAVSVGWGVAAGLVAVLAMFGRVGQYPLRWSDAFSLTSDATANLALNPIESFSSSLSFRAESFDREKVRAAYPRVSSYLGVAAPDPAALSFARTVPAVPQAAPPLNVVLVLCESFSGYKSSLYGNPIDTTPFFKSLAQEGVLFDNCFTPHFGTARGVWALITGTPDVALTKTASRNPGMVDQHTIIGEFAGYEKLYFLGGSTSWANIRGLLSNNIRGLRIHEEGSYDAPRVDVWGISDKSLLLAADGVLGEENRPFFAIIQTAANHRPYTIPDADRGEFDVLELPLEQVRAAGFESLAELNAFRYMDFALGKFMSAARQSPYFDNTLFVFIGDHGIGGDAGKAFPPAWTERHLTRFHVPLLFYAPKRLPPQRIHSVASMVDVLPTIAGLAGIPYRNTTLGRDLLRQQQIDGGASNVAFIIDHNDRTIGVVRGPHYGVQQLAGASYDVAWADFAAPPGAALDPAQRAEHQAWTHALYETSRYLLLNNRKPAGPVPSSGLARHSRP